MEASSKLHRDEKSSYVNRVNGWIDQYILQQPLLPQQQQQPQQTKSVLKSRWFRFIAVVYILFSILLTAAHFSSWVFKGSSKDAWTYQRTYDALKPYSLVTDMSHGLKMSKLFSQAHYDALKYIEPYWQKAQQVPNDLDVTIITTSTPETWKDLVKLAENWNGPISATLHISKFEKTSIKAKIEAEYRSKPELYNNVDLHLVETPSIKQSVSIMVPLNVERNLARVYARSDHVCDLPLNTILATDVRQTLVNNQLKYAELMKGGDMLVIPTFKHINGNEAPQTKKELVGLIQGEKSLALYDAHFDLNQGPTDFETWKSANKLYKVVKYSMEYEPIVIQSKTVQPWCSERFVDKRSACLLSSYLAGNEFLVLPSDFAIYKPNTANAAISDLDNVIEKRLYAKFYWEQCVYQGRQLDALGLWNTVKSEHIRQQCSRVIQNWGKEQQNYNNTVHYPYTAEPRFQSFPENPIPTEDFSNPTYRSIGLDEREKRTYELVVCQQPLHARMCGFGEKDRRPIDPPPIVQLIVKQQGQDNPVDVQMLQIPFFVLHVTLWSDDRTEERNIISNPPKCTRVLMGSLVSSPSLLKNPEGEQGLYFAFPDLSIRTEGRYTLRFSLMKLANSDFQENAKSKIVAQVFSDPFTVYSAKKNLLSYQRHLQSRA
ncbi:velvet factor-domain-containing protein [Thamnidium elegans]|nr:velvet factor-domain-containing protein [Thamnidium elegans]